MKQPYFYTDELIAGWTDDSVREHFAFDSIPANIRHSYPPLGPFSITAETRQGVKGFRVTDTRTWKASLRVRTKRAATRIAKLIEQDCYTRPASTECEDARNGTVVPRVIVPMTDQHPNLELLYQRYRETVDAYLLDTFRSSPHDYLRESEEDAGEMNGVESSLLAIIRGLAEDEPALTEAHARLRTIRVEALAAQKHFCESLGMDLGTPDEPKWPDESAPFPYDTWQEWQDEFLG